jgi:type II secretory pathway component GspD/PulD (secretin)
MQASQLNRISAMKNRRSPLVFAGLLVVAGIALAQVGGQKAESVRSSPQTNSGALLKAEDSTQQPEGKGQMSEGVGSSPQTNSAPLQKVEGPGVSSQTTSIPLRKAEGPEVSIQATSARVSRLQTNRAPTAVALVQTAPPNGEQAQTPSASELQEGASEAALQIVPLIQMDDVRLTDAIHMLAREAELNIMVDPRITDGQVGPSGKPEPGRVVSLRWENVSAEQALEALLANYGLELVTDRRSNIARVTIRNPAAPPPLVTQVFQLQYASPSNVLRTVMSVLTNSTSRAIPDVRTSKLVVVATEGEMSAVSDLITNLDTPTKQVLIEARLLETAFSPKSVKGIDWTGTLAGQNVAFGNGLSSGTFNTAIPGSPFSTTLPGGRTITGSGPSYTQNGTVTTTTGNGGFSLNTLSGLTPGIGFLSADGVHAVLSFLNSSADTKIISEPRLVTLDNEKASIEIGQLYPIVNTTAGTANTTGGSQITYSNLVVRLDFTPRISANDYINLALEPSVVRLGPDVTSTVNGSPNTVASFDKRSLETRVLIPSGKTLVLGGLMQDELQSSGTKVPLLGDIPLLGWFFRSDSKSRTKSNLIIFITPTILKDGDFRATKTAFLQAPLGPDSYPDWSAWDTTRHYHFGKRKAQPPQTPLTPQLVQQPKHPQQPMFDDHLAASVTNSAPHP